jgi:hypothetical protein
MLCRTQPPHYPLKGESLKLNYNEFKSKNSTLENSIMSIRLLAKDLYRLQQEVEKLESELSAAPADRHEALLESLRRARAERNRLRRLLDGQKDS